MPGLAGGVGVTDEEVSVLLERFRTPWGRADVARTSAGFVAGHSFSAEPAVCQTEDGSIIGVDGEASIYGLVLPSRFLQSSPLFELDDKGLRPRASCRGNLVVLDQGSGRVHMASDWTGTFPLYYAVRKAGLVFSNRLAVLFGIAAWEPDSIGVLQFLRDGYCLGPRTLLKGVQRLMPGQSLEYEAASGRMRVHELSELWVGVDDGAPVGSEALAALAWECLLGAIDRSLADSRCIGVMTSGGWDSRTLLAALAVAIGPDRLLAYSHGDLSSRELRIAGEVAASLHVPFRPEPIDEHMLTSTFLARAFSREEHLVFPHWHRAGQVLSETGQHCVCAGVYGEVLGGHYGPAMLLRDRSKIPEVARTLFGINQTPRRATDESVRSLVQLLSPAELHQPWFLNSDFWYSIDAPMHALSSDINADLTRLRNRGVETIEQLTEAYLAEHRGSQYVNAQLRSCRSFVNVTLPFADRDLLVWSSRLPMAAKVHNIINQAMLRQFAPQVLRLPMAATLVPASAPLLAQESSRLLRKLIETRAWRAHFASKKRVGPPRWSWVNFEFVREGSALSDILDGLRCEIWNLSALQRRANEAKSGEWRSPMHSLVDLVLKVATVDRVLSADKHLG